MGLTTRSPELGNFFSPEPPPRHHLRLRLYFIYVFKDAAFIRCMLSLTNGTHYYCHICDCGSYLSKLLHTRTTQFVLPPPRKFVSFLSTFSFLSRHLRSPPFASGNPPTQASERRGSIPPRLAYLLLSSLCQREYQTA